MSAHEQRLQQQVEHFLAAGGRVQVLPGFQGIAPLPPRRYTAAKAPSNRSRGLPEYRQLLSMRDELRELGINHSAQEVSAMKGIAAQTLRDFARDHGFTFRSIAARRFTPTEIASIKALAQRMNVTQASREIGIGRKVLQRLAEVEGFRFRDGRDDGVINLTLSNLGAATCERHIERLRSLQAIGLSERSALRTCGLGGRMFKALCQRGGITWPAREPRQ